MVPATVLTQPKPVPLTTVRPVSTVVSKFRVTRPRHAKPIVTKFNSPTRQPINQSPSPKASNSPPRVTAVKAPMGNPQHALKDKEVIDSGCSRPMTGNMPYLFDFEEFNGGYVAFGEKEGEESDQQYVLFPVWSFGSTNPQNTDGEAAFHGKEPEFDEKKPESEVNVSPSKSAQSKKQDDKTKREAKGKSPVESFTGFKDLSIEFEDFFEDSINEVNAAGTLVPTVSPTHGKSSCIDASQLPDDPDMPELEDIIYSDDEYDAGAEADFNNLVTSITVSPIPTTRVHKDHHDPDHPDKVYKVVKALYGLHQAPRAWQKGDILLVQIYVDDIIFGSTNKDLCKSFEKLMKDKFQMSLMGELTFFLGLQVKQKKDGIFICQDKYVAEILRKFGLTDRKSASAPIDTEKPLLKDPDGEDVDVHTYRSMIGSLMYLTSSRPDIMFADLPFDLVAYSDSDYVGVSLDRQSTTGGGQFLRCILISWQCKKEIVLATSSTEAEYVAAASCCVQVLWI
nr:hypothetical protein [Tanacetum cinerariifolium]